MNRIGDEGVLWFYPSSCASTTARAAVGGAPLSRRAAPVTTRDLLALAERYSLDTEQIATFLRLVGEHHPGTFRVADA
jgi:hypothetical protein